jgi:hypothetical protein
MSDDQGPLRIEMNAAQVNLAKSALDSDVARAGMWIGLRDALALVQNYHQKREMIRGAMTREGRFASAVADPSRLTTRTGGLARSYRIYLRRGEMVGYYGSTLRRARILETGGTIEPRSGKMLAIPTPYAMVGRGAAPWPSQQPKGTLFRIGSWLYKARAAGGKSAARSDLIPMYHLVPRVRIRPRPALERTARANAAYAAKLIGDGVVKALNAGRTNGADG